MSSETKPRNYLNNKDILKEIALSKNTFCWFEDKTRTHYHAIVDNTEDITPELVQSLAHQFKIPYREVIIREMTYQHIPRDPNPDCRRKDAADFLPTNFKPFRHWSVNPDNSLREVARSHWKGEYYTGHFCTDHGQITPKLGRMFYLLTVKTASKSNWRYYSYNDEMQGNALLNLVRDGLKFNEARSENPFAYFTTIVNTSFTRTLNNEKRIQEHKHQEMLENGFVDTASNEADSDIARYYRITEYEKIRSEESNSNQRDH